MNRYFIILSFIIYSTNVYASNEYDLIRSQVNDQITKHKSDILYYEKKLKDSHALLKKYKELLKKLRKIESKCHDTAE